MKRYVAFLRGINVSGQKLIKMELLRERMAMPGFKNVVTYIQSGNLLFDTKETDNETLRNKIEKKLLKDLGYEVVTVVRSVEEIEKVISNNPYKKLKEGDKRKLYISFLTGVPDAEKLKLLHSYKTSDEALECVGTEIYFLSESYGNTKLSNTMIEKKLGLGATTRNIATVGKMMEL